MAEKPFGADASHSTKRRLRFAYYELLAENKKNDFSVSELTSKADISRATFYNYYDNIDDFKKESVDYMVEIIAQQVIKLFVEGRENIRKNCKEKNLIIRKDDRLLISVLSDFVDFNFVDYGLNKIFHGVKENKLPTSLGIDYLTEHRVEFDFFARGFVMSVSERLMQYDYELFCKEMNYIFDLWNVLFPDRQM